MNHESFSATLLLPHLPGANELSSPKQRLPGNMLHQVLASILAINAMLL